jgi:ubiquitin carboxyl-terminal hydrolase 4/11
MDPQTAAFVPRDDFWRMQAEVAKMQQVQAGHSERLVRLEQRQDDDSRSKSIWGSSSPFPGILAGTPQTGPVQQPPADAFSGFDDQSTHLIGSLHLDADEEPRRVGATSRANSVRFDESANHGHWSQLARSSLDLPRSASSLSSHPMMERTFSHKSDGRQSSAGHSVHSAASRANSLRLDALNGLPAGEEQPIAPGLLILGTVPAIVRCWLTTKFVNSTLLYAAFCTGSYVSSLSLRVVEKLDLSSKMRRLEDGSRSIELQVYLPEAVVRSQSSVSSNSAHSVPCITVDFHVVSGCPDDEKSTRVILGSDVLRAHAADIFLSSNTVQLFDDDHAKISVPLVRPEDRQAFTSLRTVFSDVAQSAPSGTASEAECAQPISQEPPEKQSTESSADDAHAHEPSAGATAEPSRAGNAVPQRSSSPASWAPSWRRDPDKPTEWAKLTSPTAPPNNSYQRREQGIKVLRPGGRTAARAFSASGGSGQTSRYFDDGRARGSNGDAKGLDKKDGKPGENPVGTGSAFSWLSK